MAAPQKLSLKFVRFCATVKLAEAFDSKVDTVEFTVLVAVVMAPLALSKASSSSSVTLLMPLLKVPRSHEKEIKRACNRPIGSYRARQGALCSLENLGEVGKLGIQTRRCRRLLEQAHLVTLLGHGHSQHSELEEHLGCEWASRGVVKRIRCRSGDGS